MRTSRRRPGGCNGCRSAGSAGITGPGPPEGDVKQIPLGGGAYACVDPADFDWLNQWMWYLHGGYAVRYENEKVIFLHRALMQPPKGMIVDHKNRNKRDDTRANLHPCTRQENRKKQDQEARQER